MSVSFLFCSLPVTACRALAFGQPLLSIVRNQKGSVSVSAKALIPECCKRLAVTLVLDKKPYSLMATGERFPPSPSASPDTPADP